MKSILLLTAFSAIQFVANSQRLHLNVYAGTANYVGESFFKQSKLPEYDLKNAKLAVGFGLEYELVRKLSLRSTFTYGKISGDDKRTNLDPARNLHFASSIWDVMVGAQYHLLDSDRFIFSPYVFSGLSFFHFNPYTFDRSGEKVYLQPLSTEGQGIVEGRDPYKLYQVAIPYGGGLKMAINENVKIGVELSLRKTFTDYIDDVSTTYVDRETLLNHRGQQAVDMAYRGNEISPHSAYPAAGTERGISRFNDRYYFTTVTIGFRLSHDGSNRRVAGVGCPRRM